MKAKSALTPAEIAAAAWPAAVGKRLAGRTTVAGFDRGRVRVEVEDELWRKNLLGLKGQILANLRRLIGVDMVDEIVFELSVPRRPPARETELTARQEVTRRRNQA